MATAPRKYTFDASFDTPPPTPVEVKFERTPPEPTFTREELDAARAAALAEGRQAGRAEAMQSIERRIAETTEALAAGLPGLLARDHQIRRESEERMLALVHAVIAKAFPVLARKAPMAEIGALVTQCLRETFDEPRIVLRVNEALFEPTRERLDALAHEAGFAGKFVLLADDAVGPADCRLEWADGGAERDTDRLIREIDAVFERALMTVEAEPAEAAPANESAAASPHAEPAPQLQTVEPSPSPAQNERPPQSAQPGKIEPSSQETPNE